MGLSLSMRAVPCPLPVTGAAGAPAEEWRLAVLRAGSCGGGGAVWREYNKWRHGWVAAGSVLGRCRGADGSPIVCREVSMCRKVGVGADEGLLRRVRRTIFRLKLRIDLKERNALAARIVTGVPLACRWGTTGAPPGRR